MTSVTKVVRTVGPKLVPFFKTVAIYFVVFIPQDKPSIISVILKCLPIVSLMLFVLLNGMSLGEEYKYSRKILLGLICCCAGDALLVWNQYFDLGMLAFTIGHLQYILAFGFKPLQIPIAIVSYTLGTIAVLYLLPDLYGVFSFGVPIYIFVISTMLWRAIARVKFFEELWTWSKLCTCAGSILFVLSDLLIGIDRFKFNIDYAQGTAKLCTFWANYNTFKIIIDDINTKFWPYDLLNIVKVKSEINLFYKLITSIMVCLPVFTCISVLLMVFKFGIHPFPVAYPYFNAKSFPYLEIICLMECVVIFAVYCVMMGSDLSFMGICASLTVQFKLLMNMLVIHKMQDMDEVNAKLHTIDNENLKKKYKDVRKQFFVRCVKHHQLLLRTIKNVNKMYSFIQVSQLIFTVTGICGGLFVLNYVENLSLLSTLFVWSAMVCCLNELLLYCIIGNELHCQATILPEYIFQINWDVTGDKVFTKDVMFMLHRSQDIPQISAYTLYDINMEFFIQVVKFSFSMYVFLSTMQEISNAN